MKKQEVLSAFREMLSPDFKECGFIYSKEIGAMQFTRTTDFGFQCATITFAHYGEIHDFGGGYFSIRFNSVEDVLSEIFYKNGYGKLSPKVHTTSSYKPFSEYMLNKPQSETTNISNIEDIKRICKLIIEKSLPDGLDYVKMNSTLNVICEKMVEYEKDELISFINAGDVAQYLKPIIITSFCNHPKILEYQAQAESVIRERRFANLEAMYNDLCKMLNIRPLYDNK